MEGLILPGLLGFVCSLVSVVHVGILIRKGLTNDWFVGERSLRIGPLCSSLLAYTVLFVLYYFTAPHSMRILAFCYSINTLITLLVTLRWKISMHLLGITGPLIALTILYDGLIPFCFLIVPFVAWSRLRLRAHSVEQVLAGDILGVISTLIEVYLYYLVFYH